MVRSDIQGISAKNRNKLASLHQRAVRVACGASPQANITPLLHHLNVSSFQYRSVFLFLVFIFHCYCIKPAVCLQSLFPICTSTRTTRGSTTHDMSINRYRSMSGFLSFSSKSALVWNYLPDDLKTSCTTIADFRVKLAIWLKDSLRWDTTFQGSKNQLSICHLFAIGNQSICPEVSVFQI